MPEVLRTELQGIKLLSRGKVRDMYDLDDCLLMVSTDRISAFDYVLSSGIPDKGKVLTGLSLFWFEVMKDVAPNHLITADVTNYPAALRPHAEILRGRSMVIRRAEMFPVECVVRGYLAGSGWKEYQETGHVCGIPLPSGLRQAGRLPHLIFTPATKAQSGHDINITYEEMCGVVGRDQAHRLRELSLSIFRRATEIAERAGILIADTKFEFGLVDGRIMLADEVLTPDSSRFWDAVSHRSGISPPSYDKQYVRDYLESIRWDKKPPVPELTEEIVNGTRSKYLEIYRKLTGKPLAS